MNHNFPYLKDSIFLKQFDKIKLKQQFVKLVILDFNQNPITQIQGLCTGGSLTFDGSSAMRRTGNISLVTNEYENDLTDINNLLSINKKIEVLIGFTNYTNKYQDFPILWFPLGVYVIITPNISQSTDGINISLTLHDKMAMLNGECGGVLPATIIFHEREDIDADGKIIINKPTIFQIIQQLMNHFGNEQLGKIIISDVDNRIKQVMKWTGSSPLYICNEISDVNGLSYFLTTDWDTAMEQVNNNSDLIRTCVYGEDVGYILTDFVYPGELIGTAGETVVSILDKIKNVLGNYQYFYDLDGNFRFQEIKNYLNTSYSTSDIENIQKENYISDYTNRKSVYSFEDADIISSYSNNPQYQQIKNDFIVWGKKESIDGTQIPIRYHLAIDKKPTTGNVYKVFFYNDEEDGIENKVKVPLIIPELSDLPEKGEYGIYYNIEGTTSIYEWNGYNWVQNQLYELVQVIASDFRSELYLAGAAAQMQGLNSNYYYSQLKSEWPKLYNLVNQTQAAYFLENAEFFYGDNDLRIDQSQIFSDTSNLYLLDNGSKYGLILKILNISKGFKPEFIKFPYEADFFLDFIDTPSMLSQFSIDNIGRRTSVIVDDTINCIFEPQIPDLVIIPISQDETEELREEAIAKGQNYTQTESNIYDLLLMGGHFKSAYEEIRKQLYQYTSYNEQVSLTTLPIYYLEPNTRISIKNAQTGIYGDYIIKTLTVPLDINGTMSITCTKALQRI